MKARFSYLLIISCVVYLLMGTINKADEPQQPIDFDKSVFTWSQPLAETFHLVHKKYYQTIDPAEPMKGSIKSFLKKLDPHSDFYDPKSYKEIMETTQGEFCGIGIIIDHTKESDDEFLRVIDVVPAGPAEKVGIKAEDKIVEVEGQSLKGMAVDEIIAKLKGKRSTTVKVKVIRNDTTKLLSFEITRDIVKEPNALCYHFKDHNIYYLSFTMFTENSVHQVEELLKKSHREHSKGFILDLRNNSGGLLNAVIDIAGLFLDKDSLVVVTKDRNNKVTEQFSTARSPIANRKIPVFILVNNYTASAAEILAGILQFYSAQEKKQNDLLVFVVGSKTFGKGSVQEVIPISNDCAVKLTTAIYALPNDIIIQGVGVTPDFEIEVKFPPSQEITWFNTQFGRESSLKNSIKLNQDDLKTNSAKKDKKQETEKSWQEKKQEFVASDYLVLSTIRLMEMLDMGHKAYPTKTKTRKDLRTFLHNVYTPNDKLTLEEVKV